MARARTTTNSPTLSTRSISRRCPASRAWCMRRATASPTWTTA